MKKGVKVKRAHPATDPGTDQNPKLKPGDQVSWTIDTLAGNETLVATSPYPYLLPESVGGQGEKTFEATPTFTSGGVPFNLPYTIHVENGSRTPVATGFLVIDTIGNPPPPPPNPFDGKGEHGGGGHHGKGKGKGRH